MAAAKTSRLQSGYGPTADMQNQGAVDFEDREAAEALCRKRLRTVVKNLA
ncbi:MAG TPA: hypothetical protein VKB84_12810 [Candidatus Binataceae bacterium]|nr:hypothetical protein [Candidatus Binataceae bacterium]